MYSPVETFTKMPMKTFDGNGTKYSGTLVQSFTVRGKGKGMMKDEKKMKESKGTSKPVNVGLR